MPGFVRDLAAVTPWEASLERSRARRARSGRISKRSLKHLAVDVRSHDPFGVRSLLEHTREVMQELGYGAGDVERVISGGAARDWREAAD